MTLPDDLPRGTQVVSYRVISEDGHPVGGSLAFSVGAATGTALTPAGTGSVAGLIWLARIGVYLGLFVGVGGVFFGAWIARVPAAANVIVTTLVIGLVGAVMSLGLQGLDVLGLGLRAIVTPTPWKAGLATSLAPSLDPMARRIRGPQESQRTRLIKDLFYGVLTLAALPFTLVEAACHAGSTIMIEARKKS